MSETNAELSWDNALGDGKYIKFEDGTPTTLLLRNARFEKKLDPNDVSAEPKIAFVADVIEQDGEKQKGKLLDSTSVRLKLKLKPIFCTPTGEMRKGDVKIVITKVGDKKDTQFSVKEIGGASAPSSSEPVIQNIPASMTMAQLDDKLRSLMDLKDKGLLTQDGYDKVVAQLSTIPISD